MVKFIVVSLLSLFTADLLAIEELNKPLHEAGVIELQQRMAAGKLSAEQLTEYHLDRIKQLEPKLNAIITLNAEAVQDAKQLDQLRKEGETKGPLHGIPVLLKDNIETMGQMPTTAGALVLKNNITHRDATLVKNLKAAGAVILGKANLSEWANFRSEQSSSGWSDVNGQTNNPYDFTKNPCGSSAGSAVAVSAGLATLTIGTETNGSIVCPAGANGVVGLKPTVGLVSRVGIVPLSHSQDTAGPITRTVTDAAMMLNVIQGFDSQDAMTAPKNKSQRDYSQALNLAGIKGKRIGVLRSAAGYHEQVDALLEQAISDMKASGAIVTDDLKWQVPDGFWDASYEVLLFEFKHDLNHYLGHLPNSLSTLTLEKIIAFNVANKAKTKHWFDQGILEKAQARGGLDSTVYQAALKQVQTATREQGIDALLKAHQLDAIIAPTGGPAWSTDLVKGDLFLGSSSSLAAISGYPNITVPMGFVDGLPIGLSIFSGQFQEPTIIEIAYSFEQKTNHRKPPLN